MAQRERLLAGFRLGGSFIEPPTGKVTGPAGVARLTPKAMATLLCLAEKPHAILSHEELLQAVWGDSVGNHERLSHAIGEIRRVLSQHPGDPALIETLPRRGYRLLVEPTPVSAEMSSSTEQRPVGFFEELKRRGVLDSAVAYLVLGWVLIQVADVTFDQLALPAWTPAFVTYLVIVGFPVALSLAWFIELTPSGLVIDRDPGARAPHRSMSKPYKVVASALAIASVGVLGYDYVVGLPKRGENITASVVEDAAVVDPSSIAVLPFLNIGDDARARAFSLGLADDVIDKLTRVPGLIVASRGDSFSLSANSASKDVRKRLRVAYYLEGSVRIIDDSLRVVVQLIDSGTGFHLVSRTFDHELKDFLAVQDEITNLTVANLRVALPPDTQATVVGARTTLDAYLLYSLGMDALYKPMTQSTIDEALDAFNQALSLDPDYAAAHAGICRTYASGYRVVNDSSYIEAAENACALALNLNSNLDVVHDALGKLYYETGRYEDAQSAFERALAINPRSARSRIGLGNVYSRRDRPEDAEREFKQAIDLQPGSPDAFSALGSLFFNNGRYEEAADKYREVIALGIDNMNGWTNLGAALTLSGRFAEAAEAFERSIRLQETPVACSNLGLLYYYQGDIDTALRWHEKATVLAPSDYLVWSNLGDALSFSATPDKARESFQRAKRLAEEAIAVNSRDADTMANLAWIEAMLGNASEAATLVEQAIEAAPGSPQTHYLRALVRSRSGDRVGALVDLEAAVEAGYPRALVAAEPHLRSLRDEPRFQRIVSRAGP